MKFIAACLQTNSTNDMQTNIDSASVLIKSAAEQGADLITTPENVTFMAKNHEEAFANAYSMEEHPAILAFMKLAKQYKKWILAGSISVKAPNINDKLFNRSVLINSNGEIAAFYDKIHMFDITLENGESHAESERTMAGNKAVIADTPWGKTGLAICYDLRFPHLFRSLAQNGAGIIFLPSAFTHFTGKAHWHSLLRARAIETCSYIIAPGQTGSHPAGRKTYGHSLIIDPWGEILADAGEDVGIILAEIDTDKITATRAEMPSLEHDREFSF